MEAAAGQKRKIFPLQKFFFDKDPILLSEPEEPQRTQSISDLLDADEEDTLDSKDGSTKEGKITHQHWRKSRDHPTCTGCDKQFSLSRRRGHCRKCGQVFCQSCSRYKIPLDEKAEYDPNAGVLYKVCYRCAREQEGVLVLGQTRSHTTDFLFERKQFHVRPDLDEKDYNSLPRYPLPENYIKLLERFITDLNVSNTNNRVQATVQNVIERAKLATRCATVECNRQMLLPQDRKQCVTCATVFCRECTAKDAVVFLPLDDPECEPRISIAQTVTVTAQLPKNRRTYRVCLECRQSLHQHCQSYYFHRDLELCQAQLLDLQAQISPAIDRAISNVDEKAQLPRSLSMGDILDDASEQGHTERDIDRRVLEKLFEQYFRTINLLKTLKPISSAQQKLHRFVVWGTGDYYKTKRSHFRLTLGW